MRQIIILTILFCFGRLAGAKAIQQHFDKKAYYAVLRTGKLAEVDDELAVLNASSSGEKEAYEGTLLMRKAGLVKIPGEKLKIFKKGRIELETAIAGDKDNPEYHFLRLIIEEHAPKIVKYKADLQTDKMYVTKHFKELSPAVKDAVTEYSKTSAILQPQDL